MKRAKPKRSRNSSDYQVPCNTPPLWSGEYVGQSVPVNNFNTSCGVQEMIWMWDGEKWNPPQGTVIQTISARSISGNPRLGALGQDPFGIAAAFAGPAASIFSSIYGAKSAEKQKQAVQFQGKINRQISEVGLKQQELAFESNRETNVSAERRILYEVIGAGAIVITGVLLYGVVRGRSAEKNKVKTKKQESVVEGVTNEIK